MFRRILILLVFALLLAQHGVVRAEPTAIIVVNTTVDMNDNTPGNGICQAGIVGCTLRAAVQEANLSTQATTIRINVPDFSTINLALGEVLIDNDVTINGYSSASLTITPAIGSRAFRVDAPDHSVNFRGLAINNGLLNGAGGVALLVEDGAVTLQDVGLAQHMSNSCGGAVRVEGGTLNVQDSTFLFNSGGPTGGAICSLGGDVTVSGSTFTSNSADSNGGAIYVLDHALTLSDSTFSGNNVSAAPGNGGAIYVWDGELTLDSSTLSTNTGINGGALFLHNSPATLTEATFNANTTLLQGCGAAVHAAGSTLAVADGTFSLNESNAAGGAICGSGTTLTVTASLFSANTAESFGSAVYGDTGTVTVSGSTFVDNGGPQAADGTLSVHEGSLTVLDSLLQDNAGVSGGAIDTSQSHLVVRDSTISGNTASNWGAGINHSDGLSVEISDSIIADNIAQLFGGGMRLNGGTVLMERVQWLNNSSVGSTGGALLANSATGTLRDQFVSGNSAFNGGGMQLEGLTVERSTFVDNTATNYGGGLLLNGGMTVRNSTFTNNSADHGGGVYAVYGNNSLTHSTIAFNTANDSGGGVMVHPDTTLQIQNSIVSGNINDDCDTNGNGLLQAVGFNLASDLSCTLFSHPATNPLLGALVDNGGFALTLLPDPASPAVDNASLAGCNAVDHIDQRGFLRNDGACDLGAVEVAGIVPLAVTLRTTSATDATAAMPGVAVLLLALASLCLVGRTRSSRRHHITG